MAEDSTTIKCTDHCGFSVTGAPDYCSKAYESHRHQSELDEYEEGGGPWYSYVFTPWGVIIAMIVCGMIVAIVTKDSSIF